MSRRIAFRLAIVGVLFAAGVGSALLLTPAAQSQPVDCIVPDVCVTTTVPPLPPLPPLPTATTGTPTETAPAEPAPAPPPPSATPASTDPAETTPPAGDRKPQTQLQARLVAVSVTGRSAKRTLVVTMTSSRPASATLRLASRPRAVRAELRLLAGRNVRKVRLPARTRGGRYQLTLTIRDGNGDVRTLRRRVSVRS